MADLGELRAAWSLAGLQPQHVGEREAGPERADLEEVAAVEPVAETLFHSGAEHRDPL